MKFARHDGTLIVIGLMFSQVIFATTHGLVTDSVSINVEASASVSHCGGTFCWPVGPIPLDTNDDSGKGIAFAYGYATALAKGDQPGFLAEANARMAGSVANTVFPWGGTMYFAGGGSAIGKIGHNSYPYASASGGGSVVASARGKF